MTAKTPFQAGVLVLFGEFSSKYIKTYTLVLFERLPGSDEAVHVVSELPVRMGSYKYVPTCTGGYPTYKMTCPWSNDK